MIDRSSEPEPTATAAVRTLCVFVVGSPYARKQACLFAVWLYVRGILCSGWDAAPGGVSRPSGFATGCDRDAVCGRCSVGCHRSGSGPCVDREDCKLEAVSTFCFRILQWHVSFVLFVMRDTYAQIYSARLKGMIASGLCRRRVGGDNLECSVSSNSSLRFMPVRAPSLEQWADIFYLSINIRSCICVSLGVGPILDSSGNASDPGVRVRPFQGRCARPAHIVCKSETAARAVRCDDKKRKWRWHQLISSSGWGGRERHFSKRVFRRVGMEAVRIPSTLVI